MADRFNNETGQLVPDGKDDSMATASAKVAAEQYQAQADATARAAAMSGGTGVGVGSGGLSLDPASIGAQIAAYDAANKKNDDSFQVRVTKNSTGREYTIPQFISKTGLPKTGVDGSSPYKDLLDEGFLGLTYQPIIDKVVSLSKNKTEAFDPIYKAAVAEAAYKQKAGINTSVEQILDQWDKGGLPKDLKRYLDGSGSGGGGPFSTTNRVVSLSDEGTARQLLNRALSGYLGREATREENAMFLKALNVQERQNPTTTVTKGVTSGRNTTQSQTVTGGFNRDDFAERFAKSQEGYAEYQAATTYLDSFIAALESDSRVI